MEEIITKALASGWKPTSYEMSSPVRIEGSIACFPIYMDRNGETCGTHTERLKEIVCDSLFWTSLGKACGWDKTRSMYNCTNSDCSYSNDPDMESVLEGYCTRCGHKRTEFQKDFKEWFVKAKTFHEINLIGGWSAAVTYLRSVCGMK